MTAQTAPTLRVYGIRHHGPGSAKSLLRALRDFEPDCLLVEGPDDAQHLVEYVTHHDLQPPVAILIYNPKALQEASYFPFAKFSPEWQAMRYGLRRGIPVRLIDVPMSMHFTQSRTQATQTVLRLDTTTTNAEQLALHRDPFGQMAKLAGYQDSERWWEVTFEQNEYDKGIFVVIEDLMASLREASRPLDNPQTLMREAYMRRHIRKALKEGHKKVAVVCGAWHVPPLLHHTQYKPRTDNALLRGIKKTKTNATWIPWTYERLSLQSGYAAGVLSPAWYELLFGQRKEVVIRWMTKAARLLRKADLEGSTANIIEAVRLADTLAVLRGLAVAGISELKEAAITVFGGGEHTAFQLIEQQLIIGNRMGSVPSDIPIIPLQRDLEQQIKTARLSKERQATEKITKKLDLRKTTNLHASHLLHRLGLLRINWGKPLKGSQHQTGHFSESWKLEWKPDFAIRIIEAGMWGNTVADAATQYISQQLRDTKELAQIATWIALGLKAALADLIPVLLKKLETLSALIKDPLQLMDALLPLVDIIRYGDTRKTDVKAVEQVVEQFVPRIALGIPHACQHVNEEVSEQIFIKIQNVHRVIGLLNHPDYKRQWYRALHQITNSPAIDRLLVGGSIRMLFDREKISPSQLATYLHFALSDRNMHTKTIRWLEGFLHGSGMILVHHPTLWQLIDDWVTQLSNTAFAETLPLLRRAFSKFSVPERQQMLDLAKNGANPPSSSNSDQVEWLSQPATTVLPTIQLLLGLRPNPNPT